MQRRCLSSVLTFGFAIGAAILPIQTALAAPRLIGWVNAGDTPYVWLGGGFFPGKGWRNDAQSKDALYPGTRWQLFSLNGTGPKVTSGGVLPPDVPEGIAAQLRGSVSLNQPQIAISGVSANAQPRLPRAQSLNQSVYQKVAADLLRQRGLKIQKARLTQLLRVDLNGDSVEEVLMSASSSDEYGRTPERRESDYSLLALRYVEGGKAKNVTLNADVSLKNEPFSVPSYARVIACVDVDGDGRMEIVSENGYYEGWGFDVWQFDGKSVKRVISAGWGV